MLSSAQDSGFSEDCFRSPLLLRHFFCQKRQQFLLHSARTQADFFQEQELKIADLNALIISIESEAVRRGDLNQSVYFELLSGCEMLLRAIRSVSSDSELKRCLNYNILHFLMDVLLLANASDIERVSAVFDDFLKVSEDSFAECERLFGRHAALDRLISSHIFAKAVGKPLIEQISICSNLLSRTQDSGIHAEILKNLFDYARKGHDSSSEISRSLLNLLFQSQHLESNCLAEFGMTVFLSNRIGVLSKSDLLEAFLSFFSLAVFSQSASYESILASLSSRLRSFVSQKNIQSPEVLSGCLLFFAKFESLGISSINQFVEALMNGSVFDFRLLNGCLKESRVIFYQLFLKFLLKKNMNLTSSVTLRLFSSIQDEFKIELASFFSDNIQPSVSEYIYILSLTSNYLEPCFMQLLRKIILKHLRFSSVFISDYFYDQRDFVFDEIAELAHAQPLFEFISSSILSVYINAFKNGISQGQLSSDFIETLALTTGFLLNFGATNMSNLTPTFGTISAQQFAHWESRAVFCQLYFHWLRIEFNPILSSIIRNVLNPRNNAEFWLRVLLDQNEYGQTAVVSLYYQSSFCLDRFACFKTIDLPPKFVCDGIIRYCDLSDSTSTEYWKFLFTTGKCIVSHVPAFKGLLVAFFSKHLPNSRISLLHDYYSFVSDTFSRSQSIQSLLKQRLAQNHLFRNIGSSRGSLSEMMVYFRQNHQAVTVGCLLTMYAEVASSDHLDGNNEVLLVRLELSRWIHVNFRDDNASLLALTMPFWNRLRILFNKFDGISQVNEIYRAVLILNQFHFSDMPFWMRELLHLLTLRFCECLRLDLDNFDLLDMTSVLCIEDVFVVNAADFACYEAFSPGIYFAQRATPLECLCELLKLMTELPFSNQSAIDEIIMIIRKKRPILNLMYFDLLFPEQ